ncbi:MAG: hypothetical protein QXW47_02075 [Candidatus Jordarchaeales archaeon]
MNIEASLKHIQRMAEDVRREVLKHSIAYYPHEKIIFLLAHRHDGSFEGKTCLAKALCILDVLIFRKRDHIVIDYFGPEDANFPRAIGLLSAGKYLHIQRINSKEHVLLTWRGYDYFRKIERVRVPILMEFLQELIELAHKADENLINTTYHLLFHAKWGERKVPLSAFLKGDEVIYNSLVYNFYRNQPSLLLEERGEVSGIYGKERMEVEIDDLILPSYNEKGLEGDDMKDGQHLALPYLEAANLFIMLTGRQPTLGDIAKMAFSRLSYHERLEKNIIEKNEREMHSIRKEAILKECGRHLELLCERGLLERTKVGRKWMYIPAARTYSFGEYNYTLVNRTEARNYLTKIKDYIESYRMLLSNHMLEKAANMR